MKLLLGIIIIGLPFSLFGQSLIKNGGFEETTGCPGALIFLKNTVYWNGMKNHYGSPDQYWMDCPYNGEGSIMFKNQKPFEGKGFVGFFCYGDRLREYMVGELKTPLEKDSVYYLEFYVLPSTAYGTMINSVGVHFSNDEPSGISSKSLATVKLTEHIGNDTSQFINDTLNWEKISGEYKANGGERFITFGNFRSDEETKSYIMKKNCGRFDRSYIFVDGVSFSLKSNYKIENINNDIVSNETKRVEREKAVFTTEDDEITIWVWDDQKEDGDTITLYYNDKILLEKYPIMKSKKKLTIKLEKEENKISLFAENLGSIPPNTCTVKIKDKKRKKNYTLNSDFKKTEYILIFKEN